MLRADMDALSIKEETNLPYASQIKTIDTNGKEVRSGPGIDKVSEL